MAGNANGSTNGNGGKSKRGFASMDANRQREIASKGGRAAHAKGTAHEWSSDEARVAGQKGGIAVSRDRAHMAAIGREGGESRSRASRVAREQQRGGVSSDREMQRTVSRESGASDRGPSLGGSGGMRQSSDARDLDAR
ncbi:MAG: KGG domain-containing protein [Gemmatirosa sp.]